MSRMGPRPWRRSAAFVLATTLVWALVAGLPFAPAQPEAPKVDDVVIPLSLRGSGAVAAADRGPVPPGWSTQVSLPNKGEMVGLDWNGVAPASFRLRSHGPAGWSDWVSLSLADGAADPGEGNGRGTAGPVWTGAGTDKVEVVLDSGSPSGLQLRSIHTPIAPVRGAALGIPSAGADVAWPNIWPRSMWGARSWSYSTPGCESGPRYGAVRGAVVHHTVTPNGYSPDEALAMLRGIQAFHQDANGWCDIGYNFIVDAYGRIFEGRAGGMDRAVIGAQVAGFNSVTTGIALLGQFQPGASPPAATLGDAQREGLAKALTWKLAYHGVDPLGTIAAVSGCIDENGGACKYPEGSTAVFSTIAAHRDLNNTSCPGEFAMQALPELRSVVAARVVMSGRFDNIPGWQPASSGPGVVVLDAYGGLHPGGSAAAVPSSEYWPGWSIARGMAGDTKGGYVVDGFGGLHQYGNATPLAPNGYWPGWDIVRGVARGPFPASGYVLDGYGGIHNVGSAPGLPGSAYWAGWDIARGIATTSGGLGGYVLDGWGGLHPFGAAPAVSGGAYWPGWDIARAVATRPDGPGGYVLDGFGGVHPFGGAPALPISMYKPGWDIFRSLVIVPGGGGYAIDAYGVPWPIGNARPLGLFLTFTGYDLGRGIVAG